MARARGLNGGQSVRQNSGENGDHLAVAVIGAGQLTPHPFQRAWKHPVPERRAVTKSTRPARQNRNVMPGIIGRLATAEAAGVFGHDRAAKRTDAASSG